MSAQKMSDMMPITLPSLTASPWAGSKTVSGRTGDLCRCPHRRAERSRLSKPGLAAAVFFGSICGGLDLGCRNARLLMRKKQSVEGVYKTKSRENQGIFATTKADVVYQICAWTS